MRAMSYDPSTKEGFSGQNYFPDDLERAEFYRPKGRGLEDGDQKEPAWRPGPR